MLYSMPRVRGFTGRVEASRHKVLPPVEGEAPADRPRPSDKLLTPTAEDLATGITPSVRKLLLSWRVPVHAETRAGGFILAPVSLSPDDRGLAWMLDAVHLFGEKATKPRT